MGNKDTSSIIRDLMEAATQTKTCEHMIMEDPLIQHWRSKLDDAVNGLNLDFDTKETLMSCIYGLATSHESVAILYGIHVAEVIRQASATPAIYSQAALERVRRKEEVA